MGRISLLDCTLRDGGYVNNWEFGENVIEKCISNLEKSRADIIDLPARNGAGPLGIGFDNIRPG